MIICLFRHGDALLMRGVFAHVGQSVLIRRVAARTLQQLLAKIAVRVTQRLAAKGLSRWLPLLGALGVGAHAYYDTSHVAANAIELFSKDMMLEADVESHDGAATQSEQTAAKPSRSERKPRRSAHSSRKPGASNVRKPRKPKRGSAE
jgi:hypothetical protein